MPSLRSVLRHPAYRTGLGEMAGVSLGIAAWGLVTGVAMVKGGLSVPLALLMTFTVFAGSAQLATIPLIALSAPVWVIWATAFCVNLRFVVFSLHLRGYLMHLPRWRRLVNGFLSADLSYAVFTARFPQPAQDDEGRLGQEAYLAGNYFVTWLSWVLPSLAGVALANLIPEAWGLAFAGVLCLIGILGSLATTPLRVLAAVVAAVAAVAAYALPLKLNIVTAIAIAVLASFWLEGRRGAPPRERAA